MKVEYLRMEIIPERVNLHTPTGATSPFTSLRVTVNADGQEYHTTERYRGSDFKSHFDEMIDYAKRRIKKELNIES